MSTMLGATFIVSGLLEIIIPLGIGFYITRKFGISWKNWFIGALMFLLSLVRIPLNTYVNQVLMDAPITALTAILVTLIPSLTAGIFEEIARYVRLKYIIKDETYENGLTYGVGHGGIESIFFVELSVLSVGAILMTSSEVLPP